MPYSVPEMNRLQHRKLTRQEHDSNTNATRGLVHSSPTEPSGRASGRGTSGRGTSGRGRSGRLSPPADSPSSCCSTSTSEVFPAASASRRVGAGRWARFLRRHKPQKLQPTEGMSRQSSWSWGRLRELCPWGRRHRLWPWGMLAHLLALLR